MFYDRTIKYFDYLENKERLRGAGFVKIEVREDCCSMLLQLSGLRERDLGERQVFLTDGRREQPLGRIQLKNGNGRLQLQKLFRGDLGGTGIAYQELAGIRIPLGGSCEILCSWKKGEQEAPESKQGLSLSRPEALSQPEPLPRKREQAAEQTDALQLFRGTEEEASTEKSGEAAEKEVRLSEKTETSQNGKLYNDRGTSIRKQEWRENRRKDRDMRTDRLMEHKWQQLSAIYPHIRPFEDERDYLSISPGDFVIFPEKYYKMANNSFLLHGYYNYEHLILARVEKKGRSFYYVGVPGSFYDREKQVALMFGFESFECREEPAGQGAFGYYMMRMEL